MTRRVSAYTVQAMSTRSKRTRMLAVGDLRMIADVIQTTDGQRLTDPMFEHWLQGQGLTPAGGDDAPDEE